MIKQPFSYFHGRASRADCECRESGAFFEQLKGCVEFHDEREKNDGDREAANHLGAYFRMLLQNKFDERFQSLLVIGKKRTGKTTVMKAVVNCFGPDAEWAVFQPAWDDSYPFSGFDPDLVKIIDMNDLRLEACNRTTMLNLLERKAGMRLAIKGETSVALPHEEGRMPYTIITSNNLSPVRNFSEVDVAALLDRVYPRPRGLFWGKKLPRSFLAKYDQNALACRCQRCAAKFVTWLAEGDREQPVATKEEQPPNTTAKREEQPKEAGAIGAAMKPEKDNRADDSFEAEFDFWGVLRDLD
ncbi:MAG: hypothetical protein GY822_16250 [Deltaproteobacteria bacterium]|nr:hypothetical protein [Deltaproteobacteria bacterium]